MLKLRIDGRDYQLSVPPEMTLLQIIQEQLLALHGSAPVQESSAPEEP